jgi:hypothetical protein
MASKAETSFKITNWQEDTLTEIKGGGKIVRAHVTKSYRGDLIGEGIVEYLMAYNSDGSASFVGYETLSCLLNNKSGNLVFEHRGIFKNGIVDSVWSIVEGSGSGALSGISGKVKFSAGNQEEYQVIFNYDL